MGSFCSKIPPVPEEKDIDAGVEIPPIGVYRFEDFKAKTNNFHTVKKVGDTGSVYLVEVFGTKRVKHGHFVLTTGASESVAVKHVCLKSKDESGRMGNEIRNTYKQLHHPNIAKPLGCCIHGTEVLIVYSYLGNKSLQNALFGADDGLRLGLSWGKRFKVCVQIAEALTFLHEDSGLGIHGNLKPTNVLLDDDLNAMVTDLPYGQLINQTTMLENSTLPKDRGYMAPEYLQGLPWTAKSDVYSFGLMMLEIVSGHRHVTGKTIMLLNKATKHYEDGNLGILVDANLHNFEDYKHYEAVLMLHLAMQCVSQSFDVRPSMSEIVQILQGKKEFNGKLIGAPTSLQSTSIDQGNDLISNHSLD